MDPKKAFGVSLIVLAFALGLAAILFFLAPAAAAISALAILARESPAALTTVSILFLALGGALALARFGWALAETLEAYARVYEIRNVEGVSVGGRTKIGVPHVVESLPKRSGSDNRGRGSSRKDGYGISTGTRHADGNAGRLAGAGEFPLEPNFDALRGFGWDPG